MASNNPYASLLQTLQVGSQSFQYYSLPLLKDQRLSKLPYSIRVLLESAVRNCDNFEVKQADVEKILNWVDTSKQDVEIPFKPARVILQDFTGVPAVVDLAAMRDAMQRLGGDPYKINPLVPVDLVIDHSIQVDSSRIPEAVEQNEKLEFERNYERFEFLKWGQQAFTGLTIVPPGSGIVHQVNLEYLGRVVFHDPKTNCVYPDSLVGTDSHTTMINGLGVTGWGVGGIEAEAVMLGQSLSMVLPEVVGFKFTGELQQGTTATDLVITCVQMLRKRGVVGKFVEFFGPGVQNLTLADRATIANMAPEYGATMGFFPVDEQTMVYLRQTGRDQAKVDLIENYLKAQGLFRTYTEEDPVFSGAIMELDLSTVQPCLSGPKRPHDRVLLSDMKQDFTQCLQNPVGFKGFAIPQSDQGKVAKFTFKDGKEYELRHGSVVIAAITSCTNTSNPDVLIAAGLLAKNAIEKGLNTLPYIKTSLSPGSGVVLKYLQTSQLLPYLEQIGFYIAGFGCMTCIGNSGEIDEALGEAIQKNDLVAAAVLSGNRNFEGRVHPLTRANYLASPPLVVAYALAGRADIDFATEPIGKDPQGNDVFLRDIWPSRTQVSEISNQVIKPEMFQQVYQKISQGTERWNALQAPSGSLYSWKEASTYIHNPPFFQSTKMEPVPIKDIQDGYCLLNVGDSITTDHISPAGNISKTSPAAKYLQSRGVEPKDFNTYGARRGNDEVMARGTFANIRLLNKMASKVGPLTVHVPSGQEMSPWEAADKYIQAGQDIIILAGNEYGSGSSRDWAAKGPYLQGVKCVISKSFERIHRSNLVGMGILPCVFEQGQDADTLGLTGKEKFNITLKGGNIAVGEVLTVTTDTGKSFNVKVRLDTDVETEYYKHGGILQYVLRKLVKGQ